MGVVIASKRTTRPIFTSLDLPLNLLDIQSSVDHFQKSFLNNTMHFWFLIWSVTFNLTMCVFVAKEDEVISLSSAPSTSAFHWMDGWLFRVECDWTLTWNNWSENCLIMYFCGIYNCHHSTRCLYSFHFFITTIGENFVTLFIENLFKYSDKQLFNSENMAGDSCQN